MSHDTVSRPETTEDLVRRLQDLKTDAKERIALKALASRMMSIFNDDKSYAHYYEAAAIAPFQDWHGYKKILLTFMDAVIKGTADGSILRPELCDQFVSVLRLCDSIDEGTSGKPGERTADLRLEQVMASLQRRLDDAINGASLAAQYQMVDTLARVLDAMNDAKTDGISREKYREPLLKSLDGLRDSEEIRLAQVAAYAYEALRGIPDDEGPYKAALRHIMAFVDAGAKIAGAVATMDPSKLVSGLIALGDVPNLVSSMVTAIQKLPEAFDGIRGIAQDVKLQQTPKKWYIALRLADVLILNRRFSELEQFIREVPCRLEFEFLRGLHARLERAWIAAGRGGNGNKDQDQAAIQSMIEKLPSPEDHSDDLKHIDAWKQALQATIGLKPTSAPPEEENLFRRAKQRAKQKLRLDKNYSSQVQYTVPDNLTTPSDLLGQAWESCPEAQLWHADVKLREYYLANREQRLQITRISGTSLSMAQCYINLAIVEHKAEDSDDRSSIQSTLVDQLNISNVPENRTVTLDNLFEPRRCPDGRVRAPRRLLIRGQAGVGKTTLCKKIMHSFTHQLMYDSFSTWTERYHRILWLPLRDLKRHRGHPGFNLEELLENDIFSRCTQSSTLSSALATHCSSGDDNNRTLFLLDGLDEVTDLLDPEHEMAGFLCWLLRQPNVIITSRPGCDHANTLVDLDSELEVVGFNTRQVWAYVGQTKGSIAAKTAMREFLDKRPLLFSLMRIPIQLDALCYIWDDASAEADRKNVSTMASIYQLLEHRLWYKDIPRLRKKYNSEKVTAEFLLQCTPSEVDNLVKEEKGFLQALAFAGLFHEVVNFGLQECDDVHVSWGVPTLNHRLSEILGSLSFLRTSGGSDASQRTYHFVHLTYQEYFAAQYFVSRWIEGALLGSAISRFGRRGPVNLSPIAFLRQNKYRTRFDIFWRFVAGVLRGHNESDLLRFFDDLEKQPRDILGPAHQRLVMHCLSEADPEHLMPCFEKRREKLREWAEWECKTRKYSYLANEAEFPPQMYYKVLVQMSDEVKRNTIKSLSGDPAARLQFMVNEVAKSTPLSDWAMEHLKYYEHLPLNVLDILMPHPQNIFGFKRDPTQRCIGKNYKYKMDLVLVAIFSDLPNAMRFVLRCLSDNNKHAVIQFATRFCDRFQHIQQSNAPPFTCQLIASEHKEALKRYAIHPKRVVRNAAMHILLSQDPLPKSIPRGLLDRLQTANVHVIKETIKSLRDSRRLPIELHPAILQCLRQANTQIQALALELVLTCSCILSDSDLDVVKSVFSSAGRETRERMATAMYTAATTLAPGLIDLLHAWLKDGSSGENRIYAIYVLSRQRLPDNILETLGELLGVDQNSYTRVAAARALGHAKTPLPAKAILRLRAALDDKDEAVAETSLRALCRQDVSDNALTRAVMRPRTKAYDGAYRLHDLFHNRRALTKALADTLLTKLRACAPGEELRFGIVNYLRDQASSLQSVTVVAIFEEHQRILSQLDDDANARRRSNSGYSYEDKVLLEMSLIFSRQTKLPNNMLERLSNRLHAGSPFASLVAAKALSHPQLLAPRVISGLIKLAESNSSDVRFEALQILTDKINLQVDDLRQYARILRESIRDDHDARFLNFALGYLHILPDDEFSLTLGCNVSILRRTMARWLEADTESITLYPDPDDYTHYILNLPGGQKRIRKEGLPTSLEQYLEEVEVPRALDQET